MAAEEVQAECPRFTIDGETLAVLLGLLTVIGSAVTFFVQRHRDRIDEIESERKKAADLDRDQALERVRKQMSSFVGPIHRLWKTQSTVSRSYLDQTGHSGMAHFVKAAVNGGKAHWFQMYEPDFLQPFIDNPDSFEAQMYRNYISRQLKQLYTRIRELVLSHGSDMADMPTQEEWLLKYDRESVTSPFNGSLNVNVILDTYVVWSLEFDDIVESWGENDFRRMQPKTVVAWLIANDLVDQLYDNAKMKEATYNKHVKVHRNIIEYDAVSHMTRVFGFTEEKVDSTDEFKTA
ncbi:MAG: hypothetical protein ACI8RD_000729 [Bacillariaceae sp.]|jgi:hypothetical protein